MILTLTSPARPSADISDITTKTVVRRGWVPTDAQNTDYVYEIEFAVDLTADEETRVKNRLNSASTVEETLRNQASTALATNRNFFNNIAPDLIAGANAIDANPAVTQANIRSLARGIRALANQLDDTARQDNMQIKFLLRQLDATP